MHHYAGFSQIRSHFIKTAEILTWKVCDFEWNIYTYVAYMEQGTANVRIYKHYVIKLINHETFVP